MIIVHNESGLGNQMMDWAEYYMIKKLNPEHEVLLENVLFDIDECKETVSMWNGYELDKIFNLEDNTDNLRNWLGEKDYASLVNYVRNSRFWLDDWDYPRPIRKWLSQNLGIKIVNCCRGGLGQRKSFPVRLRKRVKAIFNPLFDVRGVNYTFPQGNYYCGHSFPLLQLTKNYDNMFRDDILKIFQFPPIQSTDESNYGLYQSIVSNLSVGIHIRRGDLLVYNGVYYNNNYFPKAVNYIRHYVEKPLWFVFSDEFSRQWCVDNYESLGFTKNDEIVFVKGNIGPNSYKDMQLLSLCKHQIITNSSFGWWACYLNQYQDKITISPAGTFKTTLGL